MQGNDLCSTVDDRNPIPVSKALDEHQGTVLLRSTNPITDETVSHPGMFHSLILRNCLFHARNNHL